MMHAMRRDDFCCHCKSGAGIVHSIGSKRGLCMVKPTGLLQPVISDEQIMAYAKLTAQNVCADSAMHAISPSLVLGLIGLSRVGITCCYSRAPCRNRL